MSKMTNITNISLPIAVWLAADGYDFTPGEKSLSATALIKPVRKTVLERRLTQENQITPDVSDFLASRLGHSIHDGIERAWKQDARNCLRLLGYPESLVQRVAVNPETLNEDTVPVWIEQRGSREISGYTISGKFDMVLEGVLQDFKSTSVFSWISGSKDQDYQLQGSIYRWIHQDKITEDYMNIQFIFTDWSKAQARASNSYPQQRVMEHRVELLSLADTEAWLKRRIADLEKYWDAPEEDIPHCTDEDLWRGDTVYKYYADPTKTSGRSTKNFDNLAAANAHRAKAGKGIVITVPGQVKACGYCRAFPICTQKDLYDHG